MWHKAPCSSRDYSGVRESGPRKIDEDGDDDGDFDEDDHRGDDSPPDGTPTPPGERGREPPSFFILLDLPPRWEKDFPSGPWPPWWRRSGSPSEIGSLSLSVSFCFCAPRFWPFTVS